MRNTDRLASRVLGLLVSVIFAYLEYYILSLLVVIIVTFSPLLLLPISLILRRFGHVVSGFMKKPLLLILYCAFFVPYGLLVTVVFRRKIQRYERIKLTSIDFDRPM